MSNFWRVSGEESKRKANLNIFEYRKTSFRSSRELDLIFPEKSQKFPLKIGPPVS